MSRGDREGRAGGASLSDLVERQLQTRRAGVRDVEAQMLARDREVRHDALRAIHDRKDPSLFVALCVAEQIDAHLRARADDYPGLPFSWWDWKGVIPNHVIEMRSAERLAWARGEGASTLPAQRLPPVIAAVADTPPRDVAAAYGSLVIRFDDATRAELLAREEAAFAERTMEQGT